MRLIQPLSCRIGKLCKEDIHSIMNYQDCLQLLKDMRIWAPAEPGRRNKTLRWGDEQGQPVPGVYLNETDTAKAYFTLNSACLLKEDENLWANLPQRLVAEKDTANRNLYPLPGKEREALHQLFTQPLERE